MKTLIILAVLGLAGFYNLSSEESTEVRSIKDKVRMSTLILVGEVTNVAVFDTKTDEIVKNTGTLGPGQQANINIKVSRILYAASSELLRIGESHSTLSAVFGHPGLHLSEPSHEDRIFFLTRNIVPPRNFPLEHYPFFDLTNLSVPVSEEPKVTRIIAAFDAVK